MAANSDGVKILKISPPKDYLNHSPSELLTYLRESCDWSVMQFTEEINKQKGGERITEEAIKSWLNKNKIPSNRKNHRSRDALFSLIKQHGKNFDLAEDWQKALIENWAGSKNNNKLTNAVKMLTKPPIDEAIIQATLTNSRINYLPSLFESDQPLSLADAYVDIRLIPQSKITANPLLLDKSLTLSESLERRNQIRYSSPQEPRSILDRKGQQNTLIIGPPGSGKSSLMRRIALSIAKGEWNNAKIPIFVEVKSYWARRLPNESILSFGLRELLPHISTTDGLQDILTNQKKADGRNVLLIIDGLDEISSYKDAWNTIANELRNIAPLINWVATCRPTGLLSGVGETSRCEIVELDNNAIEQLIENWCQSIKDGNNGMIFENLERSIKLEVLTTTKILEMSRNPFLLTSLCFLKTKAPKESLPATRISIYETLIQCISKQAQLRHENRNILSANVLNNLQHFTYFLYTHRNGVLQIFQERNWNQFSQELNLDSDIFHSLIIPSRLLTSMGEGDPFYHFLHLSLQEYLVAKHALALSVDIEKMLEKRFAPAWKPVFRFYGALLFETGKREEFKQLVCGLFHDMDFNKITLSLLTDIFSDAGVKDTSEWIDCDLREMLYKESMHENGWHPQEAISQTFLDNLSTIDPEWFGNRIIKKIGILKSYPMTRESLSEIEQNFSILARIKTPTAHKYIKETFYLDDLYLAETASIAYSLVADRRDRNFLISSSEHHPLDSHNIDKYLYFIEASKRIDFIPFLKNQAKFYFDTEKHEYRKVLTLIANIGGDQAEIALEHFLIEEANRFGTENTRFNDVLNAISVFGGEQAGNILDTLIDFPKLYQLPIIDKTRICCLPEPDEVIIRKLSEEATRDDTIEAIYSASVYNRPVSREIALCISEYLLSENDENNIQILCDIETTRLRNGKEPVLSDKLFEIAKNIVTTKVICNDGVTDRSVLFTLISIFEVLALANWKSAKEFSKSFLLSHKLPKDLISHVVKLCSTLHFNSKDPELIQFLKNKLFDSEYIEFIRVILVAIGTIDLEEMNRLKGSSMGKVAIADIAVKTGIIFFDKYFVDPEGLIIPWSNPPLKIFLISSKNNSDQIETIGHIMSRNGFWITTDEIKDCIAILTHCSPLEHSELRSLMADQFLQRNQPNLPIFNIADTVSDSELVEKVSTLGNVLEGVLVTETS